MGRVIGLAQGIAVIADPNFKPEIVPKRDELMKSPVITHLPRQKNGRAPESRQEGGGKPYTAVPRKRGGRPPTHRRGKGQKRAAQAGPGSRKPGRSPPRPTGARR